ncbi:uncharacterized protein LOC144863604 isoform X2 [Branchiostoma floridae x Branchiostoma japonicum]
MVTISAFVLLLAIGSGSAQSYQGCYTYTGSEDTLTADQASPDMTNADCVQHCAAQGKTYSATGEGKFCSCLAAADLQILSQVPNSRCDVNCTGDLKSKCGGNEQTVTVWSTGQAKRTLTTSAQSYQGCYTYTGSEDTLTADQASPDMTNADCVQHCAAQGKAYSATGEGKFCSCLTAAGLQNLSLVSDSQCDVSCLGDLSVKCGGNEEIVTVWSTGQVKRSLTLKRIVAALLDNAKRMGTNVDN